MADGNITVTSSTPEMFTRVRGEISESSGDVGLFRASGEEVPAIKGAKIYLNDTLSSGVESAVVANFGDSGVLFLGQNQQVPFPSGFFQNVESLEQVASVNSAALPNGPQPDSGIDLATLEKAIRAGQNIEELLDPTAAGGDASNESGASSSVIFFQRTGDSLLAVSGFETSNFDRVQTNLLNDLGDLDSNNQLNGDTASVTINFAPVNEAPVIKVSDGLITATEELVDQVFTGSNIQSLPVGNISAANGTDPNNLTLDKTSNITLTFVSESAGYSNAIGYYLIDPSGNISNANILWDNSNRVPGGSGSSFDVNGIPAGEIGFFLIQNGYTSGRDRAEIDSVRDGSGFVRFENAAGDPSNKLDPGSVLVYYSGGDEDGPIGLGTQLSNTFHASYSNLNPDGDPHSRSGIDNGDDNILRIGFEDLTNDGRRVDWDLRDFVFDVEINNVLYSMSDINPRLTIADDGAELVSASVVISSGQTNDALVLSNAAEILANGYGISHNYDAATQTLSLSGSATVDQYQEVLNSVQLGSVDPLGTDSRAIEYTTTDTGGSTSLAATVNLNVAATEGNDFIAGSEGNDILLGLGGDDIIFGKAGSDTLSGDAGADTFLWQESDGGGSTDTITDFDRSEGDVLNFADFLQGEDGENTTDLTNYLNVSLDGANTVITVDADGVGGYTDLTVVLEGVDLAPGVDLSVLTNQADLLLDLITSNHLIVDSL